MRPLGVRSKAVKQNNISLIRHFGHPNETILPFLGSYLPVCERQSEDLAAKTRYLWQDTLEELALNHELTAETLEKAWVLVATPSKPTVPTEVAFHAGQCVCKDVEKAKELLAATQATAKAKLKDYDTFLDDVDMETTKPIEARKTSDELAEPDFDMEFDTYEMYESIFKSWPYVGVFEHKLYGRILAVGQAHGRNNQEFLVYKGCKLNDDSFGKIGAISEFERKGKKDSTRKIKILKLRPGVLKFWVNIDDPSRPKGQRDLEAMYRYLEIVPSGFREIDSVAYTALKNSLQAA